jgi:hypothetical protein
MAKREADRAEKAEATTRRVLALAGLLDAEGATEIAERIRTTIAQ